MAPWRWNGFVLSRSVRPLRASLTLKNPTGMTRVPGPPMVPAGREQVTSRRPAFPAGHSPSRSLASGRSSSTTSQRWLVSPSQLTKRTATDSAVPVGSMPVAATDASTKPDRMDARLVTEIQTSASMACERHNDSAISTAIWVLPQAPSQFGMPGADSGLDTSAAAEPGTRTSMMPAAVSGRSVNPSARGGIWPIRKRRPCFAGIPTRAPPPHPPLCGCSGDLLWIPDNTRRFRRGRTLRISGSLLT